MPRAPRWRELVPGLTILAVLAAAAAAVLLFMRVGALHGDTIRLVALTNSARDLLAGSEVWLAGQRVGTVREVRFRPATVDTTQRLAIVMDVLTSARAQLREGTRAHIESGSSLLGEPVVSLGGARPEAPPLRDGDTIPAAPQLDPQTLTDRFTEVAHQVPVLRANVGAVLTQLHDADGTLGAATRRDALAGLGVLGMSASALGGQLRGDGTVQRLLHDETLAARVSQVLARADSLQRLLDAPAGSYGRFRRDGTLARQIAAVRDEVSITRALLDRSAGSAGRALHDGVLREQLAALEAQLGALAADVSAHPLRYLVF
ncbi:MAG TPA: MlaD family protein [Gemmatimonadaceae bacterium]|nr:MlaD family protein [Gemmatimonadaceae bacterium]